MTALLGFICQHAIVIASDSQLSEVGLTAMHPDVKKVIRVSLPGAGKETALIGWAGTLAGFEAFYEAFESSLPAVDMALPRALPNAIEIALKETRTKFLQTMPPAQFSSEERAQLIRDYNFAAIIGYVDSGIEKLYTFSLESAICFKSAKQFEGLGCASSIISFILSGIDLASSDAMYAPGLAAYVIEACKQHDSGCGGDTQLGIMICGESFIVPKSHINKLDGVCKSAHTNRHKNLQQEILNGLVVSGIMPKTSEPSTKAIS